MEKFDKNKENLRLYIQNVQKQAKELPTLKRMLDIADLSYDVYIKYPGENNPIDLENSLINQGLEIFNQTKDSFVPFQGSNLDEAFPLTISGATGSYYDIRTHPISSEKEKHWKANTMTQFDTFIKNWSTKDKIKEFFKEIGANELLVEFKEMLDFKENFRTSIIDHSAFGNKTRNVLQHFKGILKKAAQITLNEKPSKNRDLSWPKMGNAIVKNPKSPRQISTFKELGDKWQEAFSNLSQILKDYSLDDNESLIEISNEVLLLLESFISIIDLKKMKNAI